MNFVVMFEILILKKTRKKFIFLPEKFSIVCEGLFCNLVCFAVEANPGEKARFYKQICFK